MLVLSRKLYESVVITPPGAPSPVKVTVVEIRDGKVRLSFEADPSIPIHRQEIHDAIQAGKPKANPTPAMPERWNIVAQTQF